MPHRFNSDETPTILFVLAAGAIITALVLWFVSAFNNPYGYSTVLGG